MLRDARLFGKHLFGFHPLIVYDVFQFTCRGQRDLPGLRLPQSTLWKTSMTLWTGHWLERAPTQSALRSAILYCEATVAVQLQQWRR